MKKYVNGMVTGALMGAVVAGVWLIRRNRPRNSLLRTARQLGPKMAHIGSSGMRLVRRRLS